jgi:hypothetical protein
VEKHGTAGQAIDGNIIRRMRFACWITKAADTHSECVILIAFPRQQWLRERASYDYTYTACLFFLFKRGYVGFIAVTSGVTKRNAPGGGTTHSKPRHARTGLQNK